jgi:IS5 family transposase
MLGQSDHQLSVGEGFLDPSLFEMNDELRKVDKLLDNREFIRPLEKCFDEDMGRPGTPVDVYLRIMYLTFRFGLSYEEVALEVRERLPWRFFCHLSLIDSVPDDKTLIKLNQRFGSKLMEDLNKKLVKELVKTRSIRSRRIRIDSTTLESHISYPTDIGLLHAALKTLTRSAAALGEKITSHVRASKKALAQIGASLKNKARDRKEKTRKVLKAIKTLAEDTLLQSQQALRSLKRKGSFNDPAYQDFKEQITLTERIIAQTAKKLEGQDHIPDRIVSFHDPEARPICKGKLNKPTEFGRTLTLVQDESGVITDYQIHEGNPHDRTQLIPAVKRSLRTTGKKPQEMATDRGYYCDDNI